MKKLLCVLCVLCGSVFHTRAGTVALWKLDYEADGTALNARCLLSPANDLVLSGTAWSGAGVDGWAALPPNPDATPSPLGSPTNRNAVGLNPTTSALTNHAVSARVEVTNSFTVEGWVWRAANPSGSSWHYLVGNHMSGSGRWLLSLRNGGTNWILFVDGRVSDQAFPVKNDPADTNAWRHLALTYDRDAGSAQQGVWELFVDSASCGAITNSSRPASVAAVDSVFSLGGRTTAGNTPNAKWDYWRVSDKALAASEFLNAGTAAPETETLPRTVAYWRLDGGADGRVDALDSIGGAHLSSGLDITNHTTTIRASAERAFAGQPPNSALVLPGGNAGSVYAQALGACLRVADLGTHLETTNSFTVEGWLCPQRRDYAPDLQYIANTRVLSKGWAFALKKPGDGTRRLVIYAEDDAGVLVGDAPLSGDVSAWSDSWKHVALVYDATAGNTGQGVWRCYLDGALQGVATNSHARSGDSGSSYFHLAGRVGNASTFCGGLDCWRVCKTALAPNQFLNATAGATPATDALALWPLESPDGLYIDATDLTGNWPFHTPLTAQHRVTAGAEGATGTIPNPDGTPAFKGDPARNAGSVVFNTPSADAARAYLTTIDDAVRRTLCLTNSFTWEAWLHRTQNPGAWQLIFGTGSAPNLTGGGMNINLTYRPTGYVLWVSAPGPGVLINDQAFGHTDAPNAWHHVALVYDAAAGNGTWTLYTDGVARGSFETPSAPPYSLPGGMYIGGRPWSANSFIGAMDSARLTKGALAPAQFLNASREPPATPAPRTVAYWKLESDGTSLNASSQVEPRYSLLPDAYAPAGSASQFRRFVPVPDTTEGFIGDPRANAGSAAFGGASYLRVQNLGYRLEPDRAFTVEGWMFWSNRTAAAVQTIAGTRFGADYGWRLTLDTDSGAGSFFRLFCRTPSQTPLADAAFPFDATGLAGGWHHVALAFTPRRHDTGAWELFVDGATAGTVTNRFYPSTPHQSHWFALGGQAGGTEAFDGLLDCWRVSEGALTPDQFLYLGYEKGTLLLMH
jgi:hypothetical protein